MIRLISINVTIKPTHKEPIGTTESYQVFAKFASDQYYGSFTLNLFFF